MVEEQLRGVVVGTHAGALEERVEFSDGQRGDLGQCFRCVVRAGEAEVQCLGLVASAAALRAFVVAAITAEQHADVHFVGLGLEPIEISLHAIPAAIVPNFAQSFTRTAVAFDDPLLVGLGQIFERAMQVYITLARVAQ